MTKHTNTDKILRALESTGGDITAAAKVLGLRRESLYYRINKDPIIKETASRLRYEREQQAAQTTPTATHEEPATDPESITEKLETANAATEYRQHVLAIESLERDIEIERGNRERMKATEAETLPDREEPTADKLATTEEPAKAEEPTTETPTPKPAPANIPRVAQIINQQQARNLAAQIRAYIQFDGLPKQYAAVFDYLTYLDRKADGTA